MGWLVASPMIIAILVHFIGSDIDKQHEYYKKICYVKATVANIRSGPGEDNEIITRARWGDRIKADTTQGDWTKIKTFQGQKGWIHSSLVSDSRPKKEPAPSLSERRSKALIELERLLAPSNNIGGRKLWLAFYFVDETPNQNEFTVSVSNQWHLFNEQEQKELVILAGEMLAEILCKYKIRTKCDLSDYPFISFFDESMNLVAAHAEAKTIIW